ncbi:glycoside hydrolase family 2 protein, partial [Vibrio scophthalmi]
KRFFAPQYLVFSEHTGKLSLHLLNDGKQSVTVNAQLQWVDWQGNVKQQWPIEHSASPDSNVVVWQLDDEFKTLDLKSGFFYVESHGAQTRISNTWFSTHELKTLPMEKANIEVSIVDRQITLVADKPAFFVHLECDTAGRFDDSSFTLLANQPLTITFLGEDLAAMADSLRVYHLMH